MRAAVLDSLTTSSSVPGRPWAADGAKAATPPPPERETPPWLIDFIFWRLAEHADPTKRPKKLPKQIPESA